ncbi:MAG: methyltransferase domain-containing protein [Chloroflexi bacterium]|nr:methyltransferase domain-containing protein [Chloroflexota bacterium]
MIRPLLQKLLRAKTPVIFADNQRTEPVSRQFGLERGTPIDRYYIARFLEQNQALIRGRVLEVAASEYSKRYGHQVEAYEVLHATAGNANATIVGDLTDSTTLPANRVDCFICTQTFNFIFDIQKAVSGAHHLLKPGGVLLATVAGISQISRYDMDRWGDYWRFTTASVQKLFAPVFTGGVEIVSVGNVLAATAFLQGLCVEDLPDATLLQRSDPDYQMLITIVARKAG